MTLDVKVIHGNCLDITDVLNQVVKHASAVPNLRVIVQRGVRDLIHYLQYESEADQDEEESKQAEQDVKPILDKVYDIEEMLEGHSYPKPDASSGGA